MIGGQVEIGFDRIGYGRLVIRQANLPALIDGTKSEKDRFSESKIVLYNNECDESCFGDPAPI